MTISTKGRYGLSFMLDVLENQDMDPVRLKDVANRQGLSEKYLEQIANVLSKAGLLISSRGAHGGYRLSRKPSEYPVGEILSLLEGDLAPAPCVSKSSYYCEKKNRCVSGLLWNKINDAVHSVVDCVTLEDMHNWKKADTEDEIEV